MGEGSRGTLGAAAARSQSRNGVVFAPQISTPAPAGLLDSLRFFQYNGYAANGKLIDKLSANPLTLRHFTGKSAPAGGREGTDTGRGVFPPLHSLRRSKKLIEGGEAKKWDALLGYDV